MQRGELRGGAHRRRRGLGAQTNKGLRVEAAHLQQRLSDLSERIAVPNLGTCPPMGNITSLITTVIGSVWGEERSRRGWWEGGLPEMSICRAGFEPCASWLKKKEREDVCAFFVFFSFRKMQPISKTHVAPERLR